jgi:hypothetical protein
MLLDAPPNKRVNVLGRPAQLLGREPNVSFMSASAMVIKQWLLFDPVTESEAQRLLNELRSRVPALSMNMGADFRIPVFDLEIAAVAVYNGPRPTLIPAIFTPQPAWIDAMGTCNWNGQDVLETALENSTPVTDARLLAALDLYIASHYDYLPRSLFLAKLTILDALAAHAKRDDATIAWIDEKVIEAQAFKDSGLANALGNLKFQSHTAAIKALVSRAVLSQGGSAEEAQQRAADAGKLYKTRSKLSHAGAPVNFDLATATQLTRFVLNAAIQNPSILDLAESQ